MVKEEAPTADEGAPVTERENCAQKRDAEKDMKKGDTAVVKVA